MNKAKLDKLLGDFYIVSGMEISILDRNLHTVSAVRCPEENYCTLIHKAPSATDVCKASDKEKLTSVFESAEPIIYTCPFGITEAIVPVIRGERIIAYLISAMGIREGTRDEVTACGASFVTSEGDALLRAVEKTRLLGEIETEAYFNVMKMLAEHIAADTTIIESEESIGQIIKYYVKENLAKKITLSDIALHLHCSTVTLTEHFKAEFGITINEYITRKRMEYSERLLISTSEPLREIALMCGYNDVEYFSRTFKQYHALSPAAWRKLNK